MANYRAIDLGNERHGELSGLAQRIDNELLCVARMWGAKKRRSRYGLDRCDVGGRLIGNFDFHREG